MRRTSIIYRFTPVYLFVLLFNATMLYKMQDGPMWPMWTDNERLSCRRHGWTNLLYLNNFIAAREPVIFLLLLLFNYKFDGFLMHEWFMKKKKKQFGLQCMQHGWYLAADFQLTIVGSIIQMIIWKFPKLTKAVFSISIIISFIIPAVITYMNKFEGTFMASPE